MQLHPNKDIGVDVVKEILNQKHVIGLGTTNRDASDFKSRLAIGDVVTVRHGKQPVALVRVKSDFETVTNTNPELDWFELRRNVDVLEMYEGDDEIPASRGTLTICKSANAPTSKFIYGWYKQYFVSHIKEACILSDSQKDELTRLYSSFYSHEYKHNQEKIDNAIDEWNRYKTKITNNTLSLDEYTNILGDSSCSADLNSGYLCNFLERRTKSFGSSRPGNAQQFMVKKNNDNSGSYFIKDFDKNVNEKSSRAEAESLYKTKILPLLKELVSATSLDMLKTIENGDKFQWYEAKQILEKLVVLNNNYNKDLLLPFYYESNTIDFLMEYFFGLDLGKNFGDFEKGNALMIVAASILSLDMTESENWHALSAFLWNLANADELVSKSSPNIILYGPPGTGKTYSIKHKLDFLTKGNKSRYLIVQFHPSFTYEDFIDGVKPVGISSQGNVKFELINGVFKDFCIRAKEDSQNEYYFVADEINRANLAAVFGETLSLLEADYRWEKDSEDQEKSLIVTQNCKLLESLINKSSDGLEKDSLKKLAFDYNETTGAVKFGIPSNVRFIGMMNDVDKSIDSFDLALRRRFKWIETSCDYDVIEEYFEDFFEENEKGQLEKYVDQCKKLNKFISEPGNNGLGLGTSYEFGHSFFLKTEVSRGTITKTAKEYLFENFLKPTLKEYLRGFFEETEISGRLEEARSKFVGKDE